MMVKKTSLTTISYRCLSINALYSKRMTHGFIDGTGFESGAVNNDCLPVFSCYNR